MWRENQQALLYIDGDLEAKDCSKVRKSRIPTSAEDVTRKRDVPILCFRAHAGGSEVPAGPMSGRRNGPAQAPVSSSVCRKPTDEQMIGQAEGSDGLCDEVLSWKRLDSRVRALIGRRSAGPQKSSWCGRGRRRGAQLARPMGREHCWSWLSDDDGCHSGRCGRGHGLYSPPSCGGGRGHLPERMGAWSDGRRVSSEL